MSLPFCFSILVFERSRQCGIFRFSFQVYKSREKYINIKLKHCFHFSELAFHWYIRHILNYTQLTICYKNFASLTIVDCLYSIH